jgi:ATP-dependent DNA helicase RecG
MQPPPKDRFLRILLSTFLSVVKKRFFPLPDYDFSEVNRVKVTIYGKIIDENYTKLFFHDEAVDMKTVFLLDKVQKGLQITKEQTLILKKNKLIEGRYPNIFVSSKVEEITDEKAKYIKNKGLDDSYYKQLILEMLKKNKGTTKKEIAGLLINKLLDILSAEQKNAKVKNLLYAMKHRDLTIDSVGGSTRNIRWTLRK